MMAAAGCAILRYIVQFYNTLCNFTMHCVILRCIVKFIILRAILQYVVKFYNTLCNFTIHCEMFTLHCVILRYIVQFTIQRAILQYVVQFQNGLCNFTICCRLCKTCVQFAGPDLAICLVFNKQCFIVQCNETNLLCVKSCFMCMVLLTIVLKEDCHVQNCAITNGQCATCSVQ